MHYTMKQRIATATLTAALLFSSISVPAALAAQAGEVQSSVNMRTSPSTSASIIRSLKKGEQVTIIEKVNSYWYKVKDSSGKTGYISTSSQYIELTSPAPEQSGNAVVKASVSFRKTASTSGERIRYLKIGEKVTILAKTNSYWYEVKDSSGVRGYVSTQASYLSVTGTIPDSGSGNTGGSGGDNTITKPEGTKAEAVEKMIAAGMKYLGTPYEYGSSRNTTTTFDCSDFVRQSFLDGLGVKLPADSRQQAQYVKDKGPIKTNWKELERGDLVFFMSYKGSKPSSYMGIDKSSATITHDGIYLGDGKVLHTFSNEGGGVTISNIAGTAWEYRIVFGGSAL
ncbi:SH3 domain-containing protein [Paenibacillus sp. LHD-38]|uniref:C40 family peptidase n=1 Tax=Paenibacillus sp. LHD-38 TaxID=3072143 RepID=UPI002810457B|nr:SH3 domain-containing protein [Paenibacillus sp. LHD-38]MDQ8733016.1 SH3 domain-containing protein [Paenibacillus sp. LHD-38]